MDSDRFLQILMVVITVVWGCWKLAELSGCADYSTSKYRYKYESTYNTKKQIDQIAQKAAENIIRAM